MRYLTEIFWRHFQDFSGLCTDHFEFLVCMSVCELAYFLTEIRLILGYLQLWMRYLSEIFWRHFWYVGRPISSNSEFHVCLLVCQLAYFLTEMIQIQGYLQFWMICLSEFYGDIARIYLDCFQIILNFLCVRQSVSWLTSLLKLG